MLVNIHLRTALIATFTHPVTNTLSHIRGEMSRGALRSNILGANTKTETLLELVDQSHQHIHGSEATAFLIMKGHYVHL